MTETRIGTAIVPERLGALFERARREVDAGLLPACQLAVAQGGRIVRSQTCGEATEDTRFPMFSATKAVVASCVWMALAEGSLRLDQRVAEIVPEFGTNGKQDITLEQVLLHTAGFPYAMLGPPAWSTSEGRRQTFATWTLDWAPGTRYEYHGLSAHWVLAELLQTVTGTEYRELIRSRVIEPLGLRRMRLGVPAAEQGDIAELRFVGEEMTPDELEEQFGIRELPEAGLIPGAPGPDALLFLNEPDVREAGIPGGGAMSTADDVAMFYQALLHDPAGLWGPAILADATGNVRNMLPDPMLGVPASRALSIVVAGDDGLAHMRGFGKTQSPRAFGHNGAGGQICWADPDSGVSVCYLTNGLDRNLLREARRTIGDLEPRGPADDAMTEVNTDQVRYWNEAGGRFWLEGADEREGMLVPFGQAAMDALDPRPGTSVLDVGCGTGQTSIELARRVGPSGVVTGVDLSRLLIDDAARRAREAGAETVRFLAGDAQTMLLGDAVFDAVYSRLGVMFFDDPVAAFSNIARALRPGGRLGFVCWQEAAANPGMSAPMAAIAGLVDRPTPGPHDPGPFAFADADRIRSILDAAGFAGADVSACERETVFGESRTAEQAAELALRRGPVALALAEATDDVRDEARRRIVEVMQPFVTPDGVRAPAAAWIVTASRPD